jgi:hypothetical protein
MFQTLLHANWDANIRVFKTRISNTAWKWVSPHTHTTLWHLLRFQSLAFQHTKFASCKIYAIARKRTCSSFTKYSWSCQMSFSQNLGTPYINWTFLFIRIIKTGRRFELATSEDNFVPFHSLNECTKYSGVCYNEQYLSIKSGLHNVHGCYNEQFLLHYIQLDMLQRTNATTNSIYQ